MTDFKKEIKDLTSDKDKLRGWGTILDHEDSVPSKFIGKSFYEASHDDIEKFFSMSNIEKWKMGYWIEKQTGKSAVRKGIIIGFILGCIVLYLILLLLGR